VAVQNAFCLEMHQNEFFFYFLKIIFDISTSKRSKNIKKIKIFKNIIYTAFSNTPNLL
jgi:hypothetical protein